MNAQELEAVVRGIIPSLKAFVVEGIASEIGQTQKQWNAEREALIREIAEMRRAVDNIPNPLLTRIAALESEVDYVARELSHG